MNPIGLVIAAVVLEAAAIVAWPIGHPVAALILLGAYTVLQLMPLNRSLPPPSGWQPRRNKNRRRDGAA